MFLTMEGFTVSVLDLPSTTTGSYVSHVYEKDVVTIRDAIREFIDVGRAVVLVMHGYAGIPGTQAAYGLGGKSRVEEGGGEGSADERVANVVKLIYMSAWLPMENQDLLSLPWPADAMSWFQIDDGVCSISRGLALCTNTDLFKDERCMRANEPRKQFYNDIPSHATVESAVAGLELKIMDHDFVGPENCAWREIPTAYIQCEHDRVFPVAVTDVMIRQAEAEGVHIQVEVLKTGHVPMLSMPKKTCQSITKLVRSI